MEVDSWENQRKTRVIFHKVHALMTGFFHGQKTSKKRHRKPMALRFRSSAGSIESTTVWRSVWRSDVIFLHSSRFYLFFAIVWHLRRHSLGVILAWPVSGAHQVRSSEAQLMIVISYILRSLGLWTSDVKWFFTFMGKPLFWGNLYIVYIYI